MTTIITEVLTATYTDTNKALVTMRLTREREKADTTNATVALHVEVRGEDRMKVDSWTSLGKSITPAGTCDLSNVQVMALLSAALGFGAPSQA